MVSFRQKSRSTDSLFLQCQRNPCLRTFSWIKMTRGFILYLLPLNLKFLITGKWHEGLSMTCVPYNQHSLWLFRSHFPHNSLLLCSEHIYSLIFRLTMECLVSIFAKEPILGGSFMISWTLNSFILLGFFLFVWLFFLMKVSYTNSILNDLGWQLFWLLLHFLKRVF